LSVKLWLKELKSVAYDAEDVLDEYHYEVFQAPFMLAIFVKILVTTRNKHVARNNAN
jgi:hypothetical protein